jgi:hypothetical protein
VGPGALREPHDAYKECMVYRIFFSLGAKGRFIRTFEWHVGWDANPPPSYICARQLWIFISAIINSQETHMYSEIVDDGILQAAVSHPHMRTVTAGRRDLEGLPFAKVSMSSFTVWHGKNLPFVLVNAL